MLSKFKSLWRDQKGNEIVVGLILLAIIAIPAILFLSSRSGDVGEEAGKKVEKVLSEDPFKNGS